MRKNRSLFLSGFNRKVPLLMHCVSRVVDRQFLFGDEERETFVQMMRMYEEFCGVRVLSYCVMSNHFHILLELPPEEDIEQRVDDMDNAELLERLSSIYSDAYVKDVKGLLQKMSKNQARSAERELKRKFVNRMGNMSEFMKSLKQRFTQWYNKTHGRRGTLWEERYSSSAVSPGSAARMVAAYIDLNPLRAGMVDSPEKYRWCSYAEAVAGNEKAQSNYQYLYKMTEHPGAVVEELSVNEALDNYRILMAEEGEAADTEALPMVPGDRASKRFKKRRGYSREEIETILEKNGKLSRSQILRCKTRYFTDGVVIGSKSFVNEFFDKVKSELSEGRKFGAKPMRRIRWAKSNTETNSSKEDSTKISSKLRKVSGDKLYSFRDLQKDVFGK